MPHLVGLHDAHTVRYGNFKRVLRRVKCMLSDSVASARCFCVALAEPLPKLLRRRTRSNVSMRQAPACFRDFAHSGQPTCTGTFDMLYPVKHTVTARPAPEASTDMPPSAAS